MNHANSIYAYLEIFLIAFVYAFFLTISVYFLLKSSKIQFILKKYNWSKISIWLLFLVGCIAYGAFSVFRYNSVGYPLRDLGLFSQAIWQFSQWQMPASSIKGLTSLWADHFHPILVLLAPLYWIKPDTRLLLLAQALIVSAGVFPIFNIARNKLKNNFVAFCFAFGWLFFLGTQQAIGYGFYPETLAIVFLAYAYYFFWEKKYLRYWLFILLAMACKEDISLYIIFWGLYVFLFENRKVGFFTVLAGGLWFKMAMAVIIKLRGSAYSYFDYNQLGANIPSALKTIFSKPIYTLQVFFVPAIKIKTMFYFFTSVSFLAFFSPFFIAVLPNLAEKFLSSRPILWEVGYEYGAGISTSLFVAAILGLANLMKLRPIKNIKLSNEIKFIFMGFLILALNFGVVLADKDRLLFQTINKKYYKFQIDQQISDAIKIVPTDASVEVQETLGTFFANRDKVYRYPNSEKSDYIVLTPFYYEDNYNQDNYKMFSFSNDKLRTQLMNLYEGTKYYVYFCNGEVIVFKRGTEPNVPMSKEIKAFIFKYDLSLYTDN